MREIDETRGKFVENYEESVRKNLKIRKFSWKN